MLYIYTLRKLSYLPISILKLFYKFFVFASYHVLFRNLRKQFNNNQCISILQKKLFELKIKNIFKIFNNIFILLTIYFYVLIYIKFKDLIICKNILFKHNVHLKKSPSRISLLFPRYINLYKNTFHNFKLPYIKSSRHHKSLLFKGPKSWNSLCLNKLLFRKIYIKNIKKTSIINI